MAKIRMLLTIKDECENFPNNNGQLCGLFALNKSYGNQHTRRKKALTEKDKEG